MNLSIIFSENCFNPPNQNVNLWEKVIDKCMENLKCNWMLSSTAIFVEFGEYNLLPSFFSLHLPLDSHTNTNTENLDGVAYPSRWLPKPG